MDLDFKRSTTEILETTNQAGQILVDIMDFPQVVPAPPKAKGPTECVSSSKNKVTLKPKECRCLLPQIQLMKTMVSPICSLLSCSHHRDFPLR